MSDQTKPPKRRKSRIFVSPTQSRLPDIETKAFDPLDAIGGERLPREEFNPQLPEKKTSIFGRLGTSPEARPTAIKQRADKWLGNQKPKQEVTDATTTDPSAMLARKQAEFDQSLRDSPELQADARARGISSSRRADLGNIIQYGLSEARQVHPNLQAFLDEQAGDLVVRPRATFGESFWGAGMAPLTGNPQLTDPDLAGSLLGSLPSFMAGQSVVGPAIESPILARIGLGGEISWLKSPFKRIAKEALEGSVMGAGLDAQSVLRGDQSLADAGVNTALGAALGPIGGALMSGAGHAFDAARTGVFGDGLANAIDPLQPGETVSHTGEILPPGAAALADAQELEYYRQVDTIEQEQAAQQAYRDETQRYIQRLEENPPDVTDYSDHDIYDQLGQTERTLADHAEKKYTEPNLEVAYQQAYKGSLDTELEARRKKNTRHSADEVLRGVAKRYSASAGLEEREPIKYRKADEKLLTETANEFDRVKSDPNDPEVREAYGEFAKEVDAQFESAKKAGYKFTPYGDDVQNPYSNSRAMSEDVVRNRHLHVYEGGEDHALLTRDQNFRFRSIHDLFTHAKEGFQFGPRGEFNAALEHSQMFSPLAQRALFSETLGQNAWVNYGPHGAANRADPSKTIYAPQKAGLLPRELTDRVLALRDEGRAVTPEPVPAVSSEPIARRATDASRVSAVKDVLRESGIEDIDSGRWEILARWKDENDAATLRIKERLDKLSAPGVANDVTRVAAEVAQSIPDLALIARYHIGNGVVKSADVIAKVIEDFPQFADSIRQHANEIYEMAANAYRNEQPLFENRRTGTKPLSYIEAAQELVRGQKNYRKASEKTQVDVLVREGKEAMGEAIARHWDGRVWYNKDVGSMEQVAAQDMPELAKPHNMVGFKAALAIFSPSEKPVPNYRLAKDAWQAFQKTGQLLNTKGPDWKASDNPLQKVNARLKASEAKYVADGLSVAEARDRAMQDFSTWAMGTTEMRASYPVRKKAIEVSLGRKLTPSEARDLKKAKTRTVRNALLPNSSDERVFGPKTGAFFLNLNGISDAATMDIWATRFMRRVLGYLPEIRDIDQQKLTEWKKANPGQKLSEDELQEFQSLRDVPTSRERHVFNVAADVVGKRLGAIYGLDLKRDEVQALWWFLEKDVWEAVGIKNETGRQSFSQAAQVASLDKLHPEGRLSAGETKVLTPKRERLTTAQEAEIDGQLNAAKSRGTGDAAAAAGRGSDAVAGNAAASERPDLAASESDALFRSDSKRFVSNESPLLTQKWGVITAANPNSTKRSAAENAALNAKLDTDLRGMGYNPIPQRGFYSDDMVAGVESEPGYLVPGLSTDEVVNLARKYEQDAGLASSDGYVYRDGTHRPYAEGRINFDQNATNNYSVVEIDGQPVKYTGLYNWDDTARVPMKKDWQLGQAVRQERGAPSVRVLGEGEIHSLALYDLDADPMNVMAEAMRRNQTDSGVLGTHIKAVLQDKGWDGFVTSQTGRKPVAVAYKDLSVAPQKNNQLPLPLQEVANRTARTAGKKVMSVAAPAALYAAAEQEDDPEKREMLQRMGNLSMVLVMGSLVSGDEFIAKHAAMLKDAVAGKVKIPDMQFLSRPWWESKLGKFDDLTWARMVKQGKKAFGEKLDPMGKAYEGPGEKQYLNQSYTILDPTGQQFVDERIKHWESLGLRRTVVGDAATREIADMLGVSAEDLSRSAVKSMTAPEIIAVHDLMQASLQSVRDVSAYLESPEGQALQPAKRDELAALMDSHLSRYDASSLKLFEVRQEAGRSLRAFGRLGELTDTPAFWINQAAKKIGVKMSEVPAEHADAIRHFLKHGEFPMTSKEAAKHAKIAQKDAERAAKVQQTKLDRAAFQMEKALKKLSEPQQPKQKNAKRAALGSSDNELTQAIKSRAEEARKFLASRRGTLYSGVDPQVIAAYTHIGIELLHDNVVAFRDWYKGLSERAGESVEETHAKEAYLAAGDQYRQEKAAVARQAKAVSATEKLEPNRVNLKERVQPGVPRIDVAAIQGPDGRVFTGRTHYDAVKAAQESGITNKAIDSYTDGFVTSESRYVGREEAYKIAEKAGQLPPPDPDLPTEGATLDAHFLNYPPEIEKASEVDPVAGLKGTDPVVPERSLVHQTDIQTGKAALPLTTASSAGPQLGPGLPGEAGRNNAQSKVMHTLSPKQQMELVSYVNSLATNKAWRGWVNLWKAGLLTKPFTHVVNIVGNTSHAATLGASQAVATGLDQIVAVAKATAGGEGNWKDRYWRNRTKTFGWEMVRGRVGGAAKGAKQAWFYLTTGFDQENILGHLVDHQARTGIKVLDAYTNAIFRTLGAEDKVFKQMAFGGSFAEQAMLRASQERLSGDAWTARVRSIITDPTAAVGKESAEAMSFRAMEDAEFATFQDKTSLGEIFSTVVRKVPVLGDLLLPFTKTVGSIAQKGVVDYNPPLALLQVLYKGANGDLDQRKVVEMLGRASVGAAAVYAGYQLASEDKATASWPTDPKKREQWKNENRKPSSIVIGNRQVPMALIPGIGPMLSVGAALYEYEQEGDSKISAATKATGRGAKSILDQTFLRGVQGLSKAVEDPGKYGSRFVTDLAGSAVPAAVGAAARGADPVQRDVKSEDFGTQLSNTMKARIPGLSDELPAQRSALGFPLQREGPGGVAGAIAENFGASNFAKRRKDPLVDEMARLDIWPIMPDRDGRSPARTDDENLTPKQKRRTEEEYRLFVKVVGERTRLALYDLISHPSYAKQPDSVKRTLIEERINDVRGDAKDTEEIGRLGEPSPEFTSLRERHSARFANE